MGWVFVLIGMMSFVGAHLVLTATNIKPAIVARAGANGFKGLVSLASALGLALVVYGFHLSKAAPIWLIPPVPFGLLIAKILRLPACILLVATYAGSKIKAWVQHPMLAATKIWAVVHIFNNGAAHELIFFGSFLAYAVVARVRAGKAPRVHTPWQLGDAIALVGGGLIYAVAVMGGHKILFGVAIG